MRATSPPTAHPVAAACALMAAVLGPLAVPSAAVAERWLRPVPGEVARSFSYVRSVPFAAGAHRGVDLGAPPGTVVRAICSGRVVHAGVVAGAARVVSISCGARRVSYLPLATVAIRAGETVHAGGPVGTVAAGHGGLHLGVRREADRFGYVDPTMLLAARRRPPAPAPPTLPHLAPRTPLPRLVPRSPAPQLTPRASVGASDPAPWQVWAGLGLLLCGTAGSGSIAVRRRRRGSAVAPPLASDARWPSMSRRPSTT